jgi:hypothetical protein
MTLLLGMCQMQEDPGVCLGMVAWLECCKVTISIDTVSKCILSRIFPSMSIFEICVLMNENSFFLFSTFLRKALPFTLRDWSAAITDSCPWVISASLLREGFKVIFLWVIIPYSVDALGSILHLGLQKWYNVEGHILVICLVIG